MTPERLRYFFAPKPSAVLADGLRSLRLSVRLFLRISKRSYALSPRLLSPMGCVSRSCPLAGLRVVFC